MSNYPFNTTGLRSIDIDRFEGCYNAVKTKFNIELTGHINFHLEHFETFKSYLGINLLGSYVVKHLNNNSYMLFIQNHFAPIAGRGASDGYTCQTWALTYLKQDFGRVLIRRETLTDKIVELMHPVELDFAGDKAFSDTFYVLVNDHQKAVTAITRNFRNAVMDIRHEDFIIEIVDHTLIIGSRSPVSPEHAVYLADFVARVSSMC